MERKIQKIQIQNFFFCGLAFLCDFSQRKCYHTVDQAHCPKLFLKQILPMLQEVCPICFDDCNESICHRCHQCRKMFCAGCRKQIHDAAVPSENVGRDPCSFGGPRCPCVGTSCTHRPCCDPSDALRLAEWESLQPMQYREWVMSEVRAQIAEVTRCRRAGPVRCPLCRAEW